MVKLVVFLVLVDVSCGRPARCCWDDVVKLGFFLLVDFSSGWSARWLILVGTLVGFVGVG